jgi:DNA-binding response OmpR family regulator
MASFSEKWSNSQVLVLEDEPLLLLDVQDMLNELGVASVVACPTVEIAARAVNLEAFDVALLDVMVGTQTAVALALDLQARGTSIGFVSGTDGDFLPDALKLCPLLRKPYTPDEFKRFFRQLAS